METTFSIQQVAELTGLSIDTLRYYERIGLLEPIHRASSGHRRYQQKDLDWLGLLINLKETGMPLAQILHFAELRRQGDVTAAERLQLLEQHQCALEEQMQKLAQHMAALQKKIAHKRSVLAERELLAQAAQEQNEASSSPELNGNMETSERKETKDGDA